MKNQKLIYILIAVFCILAIVAGIYSQFFVGKANQKGTEGTNTSNSNQSTEKKQEELKQELNKLFTNELHQENASFTNVVKRNQEREIVYTAYELQKQENNYEVNLHLPVINIAGEVAASFNNITQTVFANKASEVLKSNNSYQTIYNVNYVGYLNGNILSLAIQSTLKEGNNPQRVILQTYNYNLETGEQISLSNCLDVIGVTKEEAKVKIQNIVKIAADEANIIAQSGYNTYTRDINDTSYDIENINTFLLGPNETLYVIFAYGNQNYTSEMDVIQF